MLKLIQVSRGMQIVTQSCNFSFLFHFSMKIMSANRKAPDRTPFFAASHLGLFCLPMFHKKDARFIRVKRRFLGYLLDSNSLQNI